jgi:hypothetical protein
MEKVFMVMPRNKRRQPRGTHAVKRSISLANTLDKRVAEYARRSGASISSVIAASLNSDPRFGLVSAHSPTPSEQPKTTSA